jgi:predicted kinase
MILLIITGYSGAGKSTLSFKYAKEYDFALIIQDHFLFKMNPASLKTKKPEPFAHRIARKNILSCIENYMQSGKDILLEGALVSISESDPINIDDVINLANQYNYKPILITLVANDKVRKKRQLKRGCTLKPQIDKQLVDAANKRNITTVDNYRIDT